MVKHKTNLEKLRTSKNAEDSLVIGSLSKYFLISVIVLLLCFIVYIVSPFIVTIIMAAILASAVGPLQKLWHKLFKGKVKWLGALLSTIIILTVAIGIVSMLISLISAQTITAISAIDTRISTYQIEDIHLLPEMVRDSVVGDYLDKMEKYSPITRGDLVDALSSATQTLGTKIVSGTTSIAKKVSVLLVHLFVMILSIFYFLKDGDRIIRYIKSIMPLPNRYQKVLFEQLAIISKAIIYGIFGAAVMQGLVAGVGYAIAGIDNVVFWGTITAFFSIIPYLGTTVVWIPMVIFLLLSGHWVAGIFLAIWAIAVISTVDNIVKPYLIGGKAHMYPLLTFFVILGSLFTAGFKGIILGPFALILALTFLHIYKLEYKEVLEK
ncbi:MAG: AI-2E family transporter [Candidatus Gracilibacteria bacterium]